MNLADAQRVLTDVDSEIAETEKRLAALRKVRDGWIELHPELTPTSPASPASDNGRLPPPVQTAIVRPKGQDAVRRILVENPNKPFSVLDMVDALKARDWTPETDQVANAVRAALGRVVDSDRRFLKGRRPESTIVTFTYVPEAIGLDEFSTPPTFDEEPSEEVT